MRIGMLMYLQAILATTFDEFEKGKNFLKIIMTGAPLNFILGQNFFLRLRTVLGTGVFNSDGESSFSVRP